LAAVILASFLTIGTVFFLDGFVSALCSNLVAFFTEIILDGLIIATFHQQNLHKKPVEDVPSTELPSVANSAAESKL
jgi:hypothetical protein